ncbi:MAG: hypothetical protein FK734_20465 [Asgard group archaeon]|nr:hypothetical protein [Asgard group archaeon]
MQKIKFLKILLACVIIFFTVLTPISAVNNSSGPELEVMVLPGPTFPTPTMRITNNGDAPAHNVKIIDTDVNGKILYNNRETPVADVLEPGSFDLASVNSWFFGFGIFNMTVYVSCDEGLFNSDTTNGLIIGSLILIP